ncbi:MAG TPA: M48 family metalloprotease [Ohtaekwangia sp.]|nr:M48 family metalloprotease [Ohtaekwangia sp.]
MEKRFSVTGVFLIFLLFHSCAVNPVTGKRDFMLMSKDQEIAMGKQSDPEIINFFGIYEDEELQKFIQEKGQEMVAVSHRSDLKYEFKIVDSPVVNAFAVPGGYVYFTRGIMAHFNNEAEFAGVLGHEIGHITARHSAKQYSNGMLAQVGLAAGMIFAPEFAQFGDLANSGLQLLFLKFGRDAESQSDKLGVEYATKIGYDAHEMAGFFSTLERLQKSSGGEAVPTFLSTHPDPADREQKVAKLADKWQRKTDAAALEVNADRYLRMIDGIVYGEDPKQGFVENQVFYHPVLKFHFPIPTGWVYQNSPQQFQMAPEDGSAMMALTLAQSQGSLEKTAQAMVQNSQLSVIESQRATLNGLPVYMMVVEQSSAEQSVRALIYLIEYGGNVYNLMGVSAAANFNQYANVFKGTMNNFKALNDPDKLNRQPDRIRIKTVTQNSTLSQALRTFQVENDRMEEVAVLNGMLLDDHVTKGNLIKVIDSQRPGERNETPSTMRN